MITFVIFGSITYYGTVFASELGVQMPKFLIDMFADKKKASQRAAEEVERRGGKVPLKLKCLRILCRKVRKVMPLLRKQRKSAVS